MSSIVLTWVVYYSVDKVNYFLRIYEKIHITKIPNTNTISESYWFSIVFSLQWIGWHLVLYKYNIYYKVGEKIIYKANPINNKTPIINWTLPPNSIWFFFFFQSVFQHNNFCKSTEPKNKAYYSKCFHIFSPFCS